MSAVDRTEGAHMHRLWTDIVKTLRSQTGINDASYTQWLKETAAEEIVQLRYQVKGLEVQLAEAEQRVIGLIHKIWESQG